MKKVLVLGLVFFMFVVFPLEAKKSFGTIEGKINEDFRKIPAAGVLVQIVKTEFSILTNEKGEFRFPCGIVSLIIAISLT